MGFFDKKYCDICGEKIGLLGNRKLDDGNMCKDCAKLLSPWFEERRHSTVEEIKAQLAYREENKSKVADFRVTRQFEGSSQNVYIDENKGQFTVAGSLSVENNPDIIELSQITSCRLDISEHRREEKYRDRDGEMKSYYPERYQYSYDYYIEIKVDSPWFDEIRFGLNSWSVEERERGKIREYEKLGDDIVNALMNAERRFEEKNQDNISRGSAGVSAEEPVPQPEKGPWTCPGCGATNTGKFCESCGSPRPSIQMKGKKTLCCDKCGWVPDDPNKIPKFCPECGDPINQNDFR